MYSSVVLIQSLANPISYTLIGCTSLGFRSHKIKPPRLPISVSTHLINEGLYSDNDNKTENFAPWYPKADFFLFRKHLTIQTNQFNFSLTLCSIVVFARRPPPEFIR